MSDYIPQLKKSIKAGKLGEAKTLLGQLATRHDAEKQEILQLLALTPDKAAFELLTFLSHKDNQDPKISSRIIQLVIDRAHLSYNFILILFSNAPKSTVTSTVPLLRHILSKETDKELLNKIIRAAGKIQIEHLTADIAEFIFYDDALLKQEAVKALERIGTSEACEMLIQASKTEKCDQNILDTIDVLNAKKPTTKKTPQSKELAQAPFKIELEQLTSNSLKKRFDALLEFSKNGAIVSKTLSEHIDSSDHDLMINLLGMISRSIPREVVNNLFSIISQKETDNSIKFAAYNALSAFPELESAASIIQGVSESAMFVRLAAIKALDKNLSDFVCAEIRNKIESGTKKGETLAQTILDARAKNLIEQLMISDTFSYMASNYLARTAPVPALDTFIHILEKRKLKSTAKKYKNLKEEKETQPRKELVVISTSESVLNIYSKLIYSCGFSSLTFLREQEAFEAIIAKQPCAIICDLFLNEMTGLELTQEIRGAYSADQVPVIISMLQKNFDEEQLQKEMASAQVTNICEFPPKTTQIKSWIK